MEHCGENTRRTSNKTLIANTNAIDDDDLPVMTYLFVFVKLRIKEEIKQS